LESYGFKGILFVGFWMEYNGCIGRGVGVLVDMLVAHGFLFGISFGKLVFYKVW